MARDDTRRAIGGRRGPRAVPSAASRPPPPTEETPRVEPAPRQVLRQPGRRVQPDGHAPPAPAAAQADRHLPLPARPRGRRATGPAGWSGSSSTPTTSRPTSRRWRSRLNIDSFEHLEFETRPDQLLVYTLVQGDERVVVEFAPIGPGADDDSPFAPRQLAFDTQRLRPDGAAAASTSASRRGLGARAQPRARPGRTGGRAPPARRRRLRTRLARPDDHDEDDHQVRQHLEEERRRAAGLERVLDAEDRGRRPGCRG